MQNFKVWLLIFAATIVAYGASLRYGFSQDDWYHITISQAKTIGEFLNFFNPFHINWIFFRPLSTQLPYWLSTALFPLSLAPYFMHLLMLLIHAFNAYLVVQIGTKYLKPKFSLLLGIFYAVSSVHFLSLFYIGAIQQLISTLFSLLAIHFYLSKSQPSQLSLALLTLCALLSKELSIRLPLILLMLAYLKEGKLLSALKSVRGSLIVAVIYPLIRFIVGTGGAAEYLLNFSPATTLATTMWYGLFALGFPEELLHYGLSGGLINFPGFIAEHGLSAVIISFSGSLLLGLLLYRLTQTSWRKLFFPLLAFLSLLPILFLPTHRYPHYLDLSILFLGIYLLSPLKQLSRLTLVIFIVITFGALTSINLETKTHWTTGRAVMASDARSKLDWVEICSHDSVIFVGEGSRSLELSYTLSLANGPRVICNKPALQVYYGNTILQDAFAVQIDKVFE